MLIAFVFVSFAFLGMGLIIAMLAHTVPAVQSLGQAIFLPMIIIGGVGVPLRMLTGWAQHVAAFLPGRYAVELLQACMNGRGLSGSGFQMVALTGIGLAALIAGGKLFRWDVDQRIPRGSVKWIGLAIFTWAAVGLAAEFTGQIQGPVFREAGTTLAERIIAPVTQPATAPATASTFPYESWRDIPREQVDAITYDDLPPDWGTEVPVAADLLGVDDATFARLEDYLALLKDWPPANDPDPVQRIRAQLSVISVIDLAADPLEHAAAFATFEKIRTETPRDQLMQILTFIALTPEKGQVAISAEGVGVEAYAGEYLVRIRVQMYARKLLFRVK
jgi:ABC-2 type transport system permease protein